MTDTPAPPELTITVSNRLAYASLILRYVGLVVTGGLTIAHAIGHHNVSAILEWMQSDDVLPFLTATTTLALAAYGLVVKAAAKRCILRAAATPPEKVRLV